MNYGAGLDPGAADAMTAAGATPELSIVSTMYRSRPFLEQFLAQCLDAVRSIGVRSFEIVLVNDGSPDDSLQYALSRQIDIPNLAVVDLSRNFGHHHAMQAGLRAARGQLVFLIDCDLEVPPSVLELLHSRLGETGADMVFGYQEVRKGGWFEQISGGVFWKGFNFLSDTKIPENIVTERLMTRRFVDALLSLGDRNVFLGGMMAWTGYEQVGVMVGKKQREGQSTYTLLKRVQLMVNAVSSFSSKPLVWLFNAGVLITGASFAYVLYLIARKLLFGDTLIGFTSMMAMMALTLGILTTGLGLVGIYLGKVFNQVQDRPTYIVRRVHRARGTTPEAAGEAAARRAERSSA
jgi:putative glycosyltransferase